MVSSRERGCLETTLSGARAEYSLIVYSTACILTGFVDPTAIVISFSSSHKSDVIHNSAKNIFIAKFLYLFQKQKK
jgi:hypothetical protein